MKNGRTYSLSRVDWLTDCKFDLIFQESNDPFKNALSKKGDEYHYEIILSTPKLFVIRMNWKNEDYKFELYKIKKR